MSSKINLTFLTLPVELVYRILDYLDDWSLICSIQNVSTRINRIIDNYHRYRVSYLVLNYKIQLTLCSKRYSFLRNAPHRLDL